MGLVVCTVEERANATVVRVAGELDVVSAPELREVFVRVLGEKPAAHLVVDLSGVDFLDSTGIGVMVGAHRRVTASGGWFSVVVTTKAVRKVLQVTGLLRVWRVSGSLEDALADL